MVVSLSPNITLVEQGSFGEDSPTSEGEEQTLRFKLSKKINVFYANVKKCPHKNILERKGISLPFD